MEQRKLSPLAIVLKWSVLVLLVVDVVATVTVPWWLQRFFSPGTAQYWFGDSAAVAGGDYTMLLIFLLVCGVCGVALLVCAFRVLSRIAGGAVFDPKNARELRLMSYLTGVIFLAGVAKILYQVTLYTALFLGVFLFATLFLLVLSEIFSVAGTIEEENKLVI